MIHDFKYFPIWPLAAISDIKDVVNKLGTAQREPRYLHLHKISAKSIKPIWRCRKCKTFMDDSISFQARWAKNWCILCVWNNGIRVAILQVQQFYPTLRANTHKLMINYLHMIKNKFPILLLISISILYPSIRYQWCLRGIVRCVYCIDELITCSIELQSIHRWLVNIQEFPVSSNNLIAHVKWLKGKRKCIWI